MPQVVQWPADPAATTPSRAEVVEACRKQLLRGELVVLPTETTYVAAASAVHAEAVARLTGMRKSAAPLPVVAVRAAADARDWVPEMDLPGRRLAHRAWPGPLVLLFANGVKAGAASRLPDGVIRTIAPGWELGLTAPLHAAVRDLLECLPSPLVLGELSDSATEVNAARSIVGDAAAVVVDGGPSQLGRPATVVEVRGEQWTVRRDGAIVEAELNRLTAQMVLFLCTGNTCRSPLAAALCRKQLADRLACAVGDLPGRGFVVDSAGLAAVRGEPAAVEAVAVARELGADLSDHASRPATPDLLSGVDVIVGMTAGHLAGLSAYVGPEVRQRLLCGDSDLPDPIGGNAAVYQACAGTIWQHLPVFLDELLASPGR